MNAQATATLSVLRQEMAKKGDFPSVAASLARINSSMKDSSLDDESLAQSILSDFALTQKVLRLANSGMYASFGGEVTTVSRALFILGTEAVSHLVMGLKLLENLDKTAASSKAKTELEKAVMSGVMARSVVSTISQKDCELVAVASLMQSLGRLLVCVYLPEQFLSAEEASSAEDEGAACVEQVLGLSYSQLAMEVTSQWGLPSDLVDVIDDSPAPDESHQSWVRQVAGFSTRYVQAVSKGATPAILEALSSKFAASIGVPAEQLLLRANAAFDSDEGKASSTFLAKAQAGISKSGVRSPSDGQSVERRLKDGLARVQSLARAATAPQVASATLELLRDSLGAVNAGFFLRRAADRCYELMLGAGPHLTSLVRKVRFDEAFAPDVYHFALSNNVPVYLANTRDESIARRIPVWHVAELRAAPSVLLLPVNPHKLPLGLLYLDWGDRSRAEAPTSAELGAVEALVDVVRKSFAAMSVVRQSVVPALLDAV